MPIPIRSLRPLSALLLLLPAACGGGGGGTAPVALYGGGGFQIVGMNGAEDGNSDAQICADSGGGLWVWTDFGQFAHVTQQGDLSGSWRADYGGLGAVGYAGVVREGVEDDLELMVDLPSGASWGEIATAGTLPTTLKRVRGIPLNNWNTWLWSNSAGSRWFAVSKDFEPGGINHSWIGELSAAGAIAWQRGFARDMEAVIRSDGSIFGWASSGKLGDTIEMALVSSTGSLGHQTRAVVPDGLGGPVTVRPPSAGDSILLAHRFDDPPDSTLRVVQLSMTSGLDAGSFRVDRPSSWRWHGSPAAVAISDGIIVYGAARPEPPLLGSEPQAGAGALVCRISETGSVIWCRVHRPGGRCPGPRGGVPLVDVLEPLSLPSQIPAEGDRITLLARTYPFATIEGGALVLGPPGAGVVSLSVEDGSYWARDWEAEGALPAGDGTGDLILLDQTNEWAARFDSLGNLLWSRGIPSGFQIFPPSAFWTPVGSLLGGADFLGRSQALDPAIDDTVDFFSSHRLSREGPTGFVLGSADPFCQLTISSDTIQGKSARFAVGTRSYPGSPGFARPILARVDDDGRPLEACLGEEIVWPPGTIPGAPFTPILGNAAPPVVSFDPVLRESVDFSEPASFTVDTIPVTYDPLGCSLIPVCD